MKSLERGVLFEKGVCYCFTKKQRADRGGERERQITMYSSNNKKDAVWNKRIERSVILFFE